MKKTLISGFLTLTGATALLAAEGMWMPQQIPQLAVELKKAGLQLDPAQLSDLTGFPLGAVVAIPGCSASFVSPEGLAVTNHHCAYGSIQHNSTPEKDYLTNGFLAASKGDELPAAPGTKMWVTSDIQDVTKEVLAGLTRKTSDLERYRQIDLRKKKIVDACEKEGNVRCSVGTFFEGAQYLKIKQMEIRDVRLVYAPAEGIGVFGGEADNWMWPRHTGDYAFLRAYVGADGKPADYSKSNVPYTPKHHLQVSTAGVNDGDFVFVAGYPGRTYRFKTADEVRNSAEFTVPTTLRYAKSLNDVLEAESKKSKDIEIRNASRIRSNANLLKNYEGTIEVFKTGTVLRAREKREAELAAYLAQNTKAATLYGSSVADIGRLNEQLLATRERDLILTWLFRSSPMLTQAKEVYRLSLERPKTDLQRETSYRERDWQSLSQASDRAQKSFDVGSDRAGLRLFLIEAAKLPASQRIKAVDAALASTGQTAVEAQVDRFLETLYATTSVDKPEVRKSMYSETTAVLKKRNDSLLNFAMALTDELIAKENRDRATDGAMLRVRPQYLEALRAASGGAPMFPDANSTLRITFGHVTGYKPRDAVSYTPQTTLSGLLKKHRGEGEFNAPKTLLTAGVDQEATRAYVDPQLGDVPVNFLSNVDTTGGNSGSPTLNARGELNGLLFDGNYEALGSDYLVDSAVTRSIHVDAVFMIWVMDAVDKAHNLLREMGLPVRSAK